MPSVIHSLAALAALALLGACVGAEVTSGVHDPMETANRGTHAFNTQLDRRLLRPASQGYGAGLPDDIRIGVNNFAANLSLPGSIVNDLLQLNVEDALHNSVRLVLNTTIGLGGILDPASAGGVEARDSDFGETLHVWGFGEGAYVELPVLGPSTTRDTVGMAVDLFLDPVRRLVPAPQRYAAPVTAFASTLDSRFRFAGTVDSILYESADSYAQARLLYLENRRSKLGVEGGASEEDRYDFYGDFNE